MSCLFHTFVVKVLPSLPYR